MSILIVAEHDNKTLSPATRCVVTAGRAIGGDIHLLVAGRECEAAARAAAQVEGVARVLHCDDAAYEHVLAENMAALVCMLAGHPHPNPPPKGEGSGGIAAAGGGTAYTHILAAATTAGKDFLPRAAALLDAQQLSDVTAVVSADTFKHPVYAGNIVETVRMKDAVKVMTVRPTAFGKAGDGGSAAVEKINGAGDAGLSAFVKLEASGGSRPDLTAARVVISGGRGFGGGDKFRALLEPLADKLGAAIGASRAAVDAGYCPNDYQVGQTGKVVAPELYIAVGISGAIQHLAGMKDSKVIVAVNKDENAPIFEIADYGLAGDLFQILPELTDKL